MDSSISRVGSGEIDFYTQTSTPPSPPLKGKVYDVSISAIVSAAENNRSSNSEPYSDVQNTSTFQKTESTTETDNSPPVSEEKALIFNLENNELVFDEQNLQETFLKEWDDIHSHPPPQ